jgi:hypothetical protein
VRFVARVSAGIDIIHYSAESILNTEQSETDIGPAVELGAGVLLDLHPRVSLGGWLALPIAVHFEEDDPGDPADADLEYTGIDFDIVFGVTFRL